MSHLQHIRQALRQSRMFVCAVTPAWLRTPACQMHWQEARRLGLPIRVLVQPGLRLPEDLFVGCQDLQIAVSQGAAQDVEQILAWLEALP